jgi:hypothetical protein
LSFQELRDRLVSLLSDRVRNGQATERGLARLTGISQPHIHHVLAGRRRLSLEMADRILRKLEMDLLDLIGPAELAGAIWSGRIAPAAPQEMRAEDGVSWNRNAEERCC